VFEELVNQLRALAETFAAQEQMEIIELKVHPRKTMLSIEVLADKIEGRINLDECAYLNKKITREIEEKQLIPGDWSTEVSSPGLDRALKTYNDFRRVVGEKIRFHLSDAVVGKVEHEGVLEALDQKQLVIVNSKNERVIIPFEAVHMGKLLI